MKNKKYATQYWLLIAKTSLVVKSRYVKTSMQISKEVIQKIDKSCIVDEQSILQFNDLQPTFSKIFGKDTALQDISNEDYIGWIAKTINVFPIGTAAASIAYTAMPKPGALFMNSLT